MVDSIVPFLVSHALLFYGLGYTSVHSVQRYFLAALIVVSCVISARSTIAQTIPGLVGGEYSIGFAFHASHYLLLARLSPPFPASASPSGRRAWSFDQIFTARWGVAYIPPFDRAQPSRVPTRGNFLLSRLWDLAWTAGLIYLYHTYTLQVVLEDFTTVPDGFLHRLHDLSARELVIRLYVNFGGMMEVYCALRGLYSLASLVGVALFADAPARWPPLFGRLADAYSLRRYYSHFWHHLMRKAFTAHARFLAARLGFRYRGAATRYVVIILTFACSAALHVASAPVSLRCGIAPQLQFYTSVVAAIVGEDLLLKALNTALASQKATAASSGKADPKSVPITPRTAEKQPVQSSGGESGDEDELPALWVRSIGYAWVSLFFLWSGSKLVYSTQHCMYSPHRPWIPEWTGVVLDRNRSVGVE